MLYFIVAALAGEPLDGAQVYQDNCSRCHNPRTPADLGPDAWRAVSFHMRVKANLSNREFQALEAFLAPAEPGTDPGIEGLPEICSTCHDTQRIQDAIDAGRDLATWTATMDRMRLYGAAISAEEAADIAAFLATQSKN